MYVWVKSTTERGDDNATEKRAPAGSPDVSHPLAPSPSSEHGNRTMCRSPVEAPAR